VNDALSVALSVAPAAFIAGTVGVIIYAYGNHFLKKKKKGGGVEKDIEERERQTETKREDS
jgi:hypothetical protein